MQDDKVLFTVEMKKDYKILIPNMLPMHFKLIIEILNKHGYNAELLEDSGKHISECGLKYVHNDTCYPAILVIGQFIHALQSGKYDPDKTALLLMQTGGGCRASNYISLLRKALKKAGYPQVPVISFNLAGIENHPGFKVTLSLLHQLLYAVLYGDLLMLLKNQCLPYEVNKGNTEAVCEKWTKRLASKLVNERISYRNVKNDYVKIAKDFKRIKRRKEDKLKVGVVGEIFVKYSPLGNNNLEDFLIKEGAEVVVPGLLDFCLYCVFNNIYDTKLYGVNKPLAAVYKFAYKFLTSKQKDIIKIVCENSDFAPMGSFEHTVTLTKGFIGRGTKMGEGWLLCAEMIELAEMDVKNIVCTQPFGCLPNHIAGKGMMKPIKERIPGVNIVAIDYDPGATAINQENRIKLMLANGRLNKSREKVKN